MNLPTLAKLKKQAVPVWYINTIAGFTALLYAASQSLNLTPDVYILWGISTVLLLATSWFPGKIPPTRTYFTCGNVFVFLGLFTGGIAPAVFLAALQGYIIAFRLKRDSVFCIFEASAASLSALVAGKVFYAALYLFGVLSAFPLGVQNISFEYLAFATTFAATVFFFINFAVNGVFRILTERVSFFEIWFDEYLWLIPHSIIAVVLVCPMQILSVKFGLFGSLLFLPPVALTHFLAWFFLNRITLKHQESRLNEYLHLATVESLAAAIDARDQMSHGHVRRVQFYAKRMAQLLDLSKEHIKALETAALLHGVGKLAVPDQILNKPQPLNQAELEKIKTYTEAGAAILAQVNFPYPVTQTILYHREHWDGTGYPEGLRDEEIPLTSRILAIADAYDTLRENRPYRPAKSREEARKILLAGAGTEFDPKLTDIFLRNLHHFEKEIESNGLYLEETDKTGFSFNLEDAQTSENVAKSQTYFEQIKQANRESFSLFELAREFSSSLELPNILQLFGRKVQELVSCETCIIYLYDEITERANPAFLDGRNTVFLETKTVEFGEGITGLALKKRHSLESVNPIEDFGAEFYDIAAEYTAMAAVPLVSEQRLIGVLSVYSTKLIGYSDEEMRLLETISHIATDALSRAIAHAESETRALTDPMTGLPNARSLQIHFDKEAARASRNNRSFQVLMLDLDEFKAVNDTFGHKVGDLLLKEISKVMRGQLREYDFLARYAGDEFVAVLPDLTAERAGELCQRMEQAVLNFRLPVEGRGFARVGISIGIAAFPQDGESLDQVLIAADKMMYDVKAGHKSKRQNTSTPSPVVVEPLTPPLQASEITWPMPPILTRFEDSSAEPLQFEKSTKIELLKIDEIFLEDLGETDLLELEDFDFDEGNIFNGKINSDAVN